MHDELQRGQLLGPQCSGTGVVELRRERAQHAQVVAGLEARCGNDCAALDIVDGVSQLGEAIRRVDVHEDEAGLGGRELRDGPFRIVRRPHADAIARLQSERQQARGTPVDAFAKLRIAPPDRLVPDHERFTVRVLLRCAVEFPPDRRV